MLAKLRPTKELENIEVSYQYRCLLCIKPLKDFNNGQDHIDKIHP